MYVADAFWLAGLSKSSTIGSAVSGLVNDAGEKSRVPLEFSRLSFTLLGPTTVIQISAMFGVYTSG